MDLCILMFIAPQLFSLPSTYLQSSLFHCSSPFLKGEFYTMKTNESNARQTSKETSLVRKHVNIDLANKNGVLFRHLVMRRKSGKLGELSFRRTPRRDASSDITQLPSSYFHLYSSEPDLASINPGNDHVSVASIINDVESQSAPIRKRSDILAATHWMTIHIVRLKSSLCLTNSSNLYI